MKKEKVQSNEEEQILTWDISTSAVLRYVLMDLGGLAGGWAAWPPFPSHPMVFFLLMSLKASFNY